MFSLMFLVVTFASYRWIWPATAPYILYHIKLKASAVIYPIAVTDALICRCKGTIFFF